MMCASLPAAPLHPHPQMHLDVFKEDPQYREHEEEYAAIRWVGVG